MKVPEKIKNIEINYQKVKTEESVSENDKAEYSASKNNILCYFLLSILFLVDFTLAIRNTFLFNQGYYARITLFNISKLNKTKQKTI